MIEAFDVDPSDPQRRPREKIPTPVPPQIGWPKGVAHGPLKSQFFTTEADTYCPGTRARLQACADKHMAHVMPGSSGPHVAVLKVALQMILQAMPGWIPCPDPDAKNCFGRAMAVNVLTYKKKLQIVNREYQKVADNIIGITTVRALDHQLYSAKL